MQEKHTQQPTLRRAGGCLIALFGVFALFGGLFVPIDVVLEDPEIVPAPESFVAIWIIAMGLLVAAWPSRRGRERRR